MKNYILLIALLISSLTIVISCRKLIEDPNVSYVPLNVDRDNCYNGEFDPDLGELGIDCGGTCPGNCQEPVAICQDSIDLNKIIVEIYDSNNGNLSSNDTLDCDPFTLNLNSSSTLYNTYSTTSSNGMNIEIKVSKNNYLTYPYDTTSFYGANFPYQLNSYNAFFGSMNSFEALLKITGGSYGWANEYFYLIDSALNTGNSEHQQLVINTSENNGLIFTVCQVWKKVGSWPNYQDVYVKFKLTYNP
jgi:hypothetical protein